MPYALTPDERDANLKLIDEENRQMLDARTVLIDILPQFSHLNGYCLKRLLTFYLQHPDRMYDDIDWAEEQQHSIRLRAAREFCVAQGRPNLSDEDALAYFEAHGKSALHR